MTIHYLGKTYNTSIHADLTDEEYASLVEGLRSKPSVDEVRFQMKQVCDGGFEIDRIYDFFVRDIAYKTKLLYNNWTIEEAIRYKPLMEFFAGKVAENKKVYPDNLPLYKKIETAFRLCGFKTCSKPSNFPIKVMDRLLWQYCGINGNYMDYSCGWGVRLLSSLRRGCNYFGTDPNTELVPKLQEMYGMYKSVSALSPSADIRCQGSQRCIPEWIGKMDFVFSSPPYFNLEDYRIGEEQSYKDGTTYEQWINNYVTPTIDNCYAYLKPGKVFGFNVKNTKYIPHDLEGDWDRIATEVGFKKFREVTLTNITRVSGHRHADSENTMTFHDNDELIRLYRK